MEYDLCVIGCGPGGFAAAMRAIDLGKNVCIVESGNIGGAGVKCGALSSKTLWELSKDYAGAARINRGFRASGLKVDFGAVQDTVDAAAKERQYQMLSQIETYKPGNRLGYGSVAFLRGKGQFESPTTLRVEMHDGSNRIISAVHFMIATGSTPREFPGIPFDHDSVISSDDISSFKSFPKRMAVIGAGIVGCEFASIFSNFGQTQVFLVDYKDRILPYEDSDISQFVGDSLKQNGVTIFHSASMRKVHKQEDGLELILDFDDGHSEVVEVDCVLVSIGREPNLDGLGLEKISILPDNRGRLVTDGTGRVQGNIYACGDVTVHPALVNMAEIWGRHGVDAMYGLDRRPVTYRNMATIMFFNPEIAAVGLNETQCQEMGLPYRVASYANKLLARPIAMRATSGFVKIIVSDDENMRILGMRAAGPQVSSTIMSIALSIEQGQGIWDVLQTVFPHPAMSEGIQECLRLFFSSSIYKPAAFPHLLSLKRWHPDDGYISCVY